MPVIFQTVQFFSSLWSYDGIKPLVMWGLEDFWLFSSDTWHEQRSKAKQGVFDMDFLTPVRCASTVNPFRLVNTFCKIYDEFNLVSLFCTSILERLKYFQVLIKCLEITTANFVNWELMCSPLCKYDLDFYKAFFLFYLLVVDLAFWWQICNGSFLKSQENLFATA